MSDYIELKSGRKLSVNCNFVSINDKLEIAEGWDGGLPLAPFEDDYDYDEDHFTKEEAIELAELMIERWIKYKNKCMECNACDNALKMK